MKDIKCFLLFILSSVFITTTYAQIPDELKNLYGKNKVVTKSDSTKANASVKTGNSTSKSSIGNSKDEDWFFHFLAGGLFIIEQDYLLFSPEENQEYGKDGNDYFGRRFALGISDKNGTIWCGKDLNTPWDFDPEYDEYRNDKTIEPKLSNWNYRNVKQFDFLGKTRKKNEPSLYNLKNDLTEYLYTKNPQNVTGIYITTDNLESVGSILWFYINDDEKLEEAVTLSVVKQSGDFDPTQGPISIDPPVRSGKKVVGGGVFYTNTDKPGEPKFSFLGVAYEDKEGWRLAFLPQEAITTQAKSNIKQNTKVNTGGKNRLTPIGKSGNKKKEKTEGEEEKPNEVLEVGTIEIIVLNEDGSPHNGLYLGLELDKETVARKTKKGGRITAEVMQSHTRIYFEGDEIGCLKKGQCVTLIYNTRFRNIEVREGEEDKVNCP